MKFKIGFDKKDKKKLFNYWNEILNNNVWSEGKYTKLFEEKCSLYINRECLSFSSWTGATEPIIEFFNLKNQIVLCPSNTFQATPLISKQLGCKIKFVDCNKSDLCMSFEDLKIKVKKYKPKAVWITHIGGHIAFEIDKIANYCKQNKILLLEDCAHAHGASYNGKKAGTWGDAGVYSFYATKTISTGEGGILVSKNKNLLDFAKQFRNYGKPNLNTIGKNFRINEFNSALGCVQIDRLDDIVEWKNNYVDKIKNNYSNTLKLPDKMISGFYKFIIFQKINNGTGKVYEKGCHKIFGEKVNLPNTDWVNKNHWCIPVYYKG